MLPEPHSRRNLVTSPAHADPSTYPPLDTLKPVAEGIWIVDSGPLRLLGIPVPVRMTVIRLGNGDLLVHSPTRFEGALSAEMQRLGRLRHLVAPNVAHWSFLQEWQRRHPDALTWGAPGLRKRAQVQKSPVRIDRELGEAAPEDWAGEIDQVIVPGAAGFREVDLYHKASRTLVLTDLVVNLEPEKMPAWLRPGARLLGVVAPNGRAPAYLRLVVRAKRQEAAAAARRMLEWNPERVVFAHGRWFERDGAAALRRSWSWLV